MVAIRGHFDGKVIVPDEPIDLPVNQRLRLHVEVLGASMLEPNGAKVIEAFRNAKFSKEDLDAMERAIEEGCERIDDDDQDLRF